MKIIQFKRAIKSSIIRRKADLINIVINACELINQKQFTSLNSIDDLEKNYPFILIDKTSRIFLYEESKIFSISFPLQINLDKNHVIFLGVPLTSGLLSIASSVLKDFDERKSVVELIEKIFENEEYNELLNADQQIIGELIGLFISYEAGYIRYDCDLENYEKYKLLGKPNLHPLNHLDINYSSYATYKLGIKNELDIKTFLDCLNPNTDCWFFK